MKIEKKYNRVGYACQAVGSLVLGWYLTLSMENYYDEKMVFHYSLFGLLIIALIGLFLTYFLYNRSN